MRNDETELECKRKELGNWKLDVFELERGTSLMLVYEIAQC